MPNPFQNPFYNPFTSQQQQNTPSYINNMMRLQAAGVQPPQPNRNQFFKSLLAALDIIDRPLNTITGGVNAFLQEGTLDAAGRGAVEGLTGKRRTRGSDILKTMGVENKAATFAGGLAMDIALNPITWLGGWGAITRPMTEGVSSAWRGAVSSGLEKAGVEGVKEALKQKTKQYGLDLVDDVVTRFAEQGSQDAVRAVAKESIRQAANRGFTREVAEAFAEAMAQQAGAGLTPQQISKAATNLARGLSKSGGKIGNIGLSVLDLTKDSLKPLDVVGNRLAQVISKPAMGFGEKVGALGSGRVGQAAAGISDWVGTVFNTQHPRYLADGLMAHMSNYKQATKQLEKLTNSPALQSILSNNPKLLTMDLGEAQQILAPKDWDILQQFRHLKDFTKENPYLSFRSRFVEAPIDSILQAKQSSREGAATIQHLLENSRLSKLSPDEAAKVAEAIEAPLDFINDVIANRNTNARLMGLARNSKLQETLTKLTSAGIDVSNLPDTSIGDLVKRGVISKSETGKLKEFLSLTKFAAEHPEIAAKNYSKEVVKLARNAVDYQQHYDKLINDLATATDPKIKTKLLQAKELVDSADDMLQRVGQADPEMGLTIMEYLGNMRDAAAKYGIPEKDMRRYYIPHIYDKMPERLADKVDVKYVGKHPQVRRQLSANSTHLEKRTIDTIKRAEKLGYMPKKDLLELQFAYEQKMTQRQVRRELFSDLMDKGVIQSVEAGLDPGEWVRDAGLFKDMPFDKKVAIHKETYHQLKQLDNLLTDNNELHKLWRAVDGVQGLWKSSVTVMRPTWHVQNVVGNITNSYLAGLKDPTRYVAAKNIMDDNFDAATKYLAKRMPGSNMTGEVVKDLFDKHVGEGFGKTLGDTVRDTAAQAADLRMAHKTVGERAAAIVSSPGVTGKAKAALAGIRNIGEGIETNAKLALFMDRLIKGDTPDQAGKVVRAVLFDYSDLTKVERGIRRLVPFYTWTRKNLPLQLQALMYDPGKLQNIRLLQQNLASATGMDMSNMPEYAQSGAFPVSQDKYLSLGLPWDTLNTITNPRDLVSMLSPAIRTPIELATNRQMFSDKPIRRYPSQGMDATNVADIAGYLVNQFGAARDLGGMTKAATQSADYRRKVGSSATPPLWGDSPDALMRALGMALSPMVKGYDADAAQKYAEYDYSQQLIDLIRILQEQGVVVPTLNDINREVFSGGKRKRR